MPPESADRQILKLDSAAYFDLKRMASKRLFRNPIRRLMSCTSLVHESILKFRTLADLDDVAQRKRFFATMAYVMRSVLVDVMRHRNCQIKHALLSRVMSQFSSKPDYSEEHCRALDAALSKLCMLEPDIGHVVQLKVFSGLKYSEIAEQLDISLRTAKRYWVYGKAWLKVELDHDIEH